MIDLNIIDIYDFIKLFLQQTVNPIKCLECILILIILC